VLVGKENLRAKDNWDPQHWQKKHDTDSDSQMGDKLVESVEMVKHFTLFV